MASTGPLFGVPQAMKPGDVIAGAHLAGRRVGGVRVVPEVSGGMVVEEPQTGRSAGDAGAGLTRASARSIAPRRRTRQPGSTIKPFVYATGLDNGMTPASMVAGRHVSASIRARRWARSASATLAARADRAATRCAGGLEQSRNLMTVRIANDAGNGQSGVKTIKAVGIGEYKPFLSMALGGGRYDRREDDQCLCRACQPWPPARSDAGRLCAEPRLAR